MLAAVREAPHLLHSTMVSRVEGSLRRIVSADLHISQVTYSLMYFRKRLSYILTYYYLLYMRLYSRYKIAMI